MVKHLLWDMTGKFGAQALSLLLSFVLTRLLDPVEFGIAGIAMVIIFVSSVFLDMGFTRALIQQKETGQQAYSSVFFLNLLLGSLLMLGCFFLAQPIAVFYDQPALKPVLQVLSSLFLINALTIVPTAILTRQMKFKQMAIAGLISASLAGTTSIILAIKGYGVWSLVWQYLLSSGLMALLVFYFAKWRPAMLIDKATLRPLWVYGSRMFSSTLLSTIITRLDVFIIGKLFTAATLGFYTRAQSIDSAVRGFSAGSLSAVFFPAVARLQEDRAELLPLYKRYLHFGSFIAVGAAGLLYVITPDLFRVLFTEKWDGAAVYFQLMCIAGFAWPISAIMVNVIAGVGNSKAYFKLEMIRVAIQLPLYIFGLAIGISFFLWTMVAVRIISLSLNAYFVSSELKIKTGEQLAIVCGYLLQGLIAVLATMAVFYYLPVSNIMVRLFLTLLLYGFLYLLLQYMIKTNAFKELLLFYRRVVVRT